MTVSTAPSALVIGDCPSFYFDDQFGVGETDSIAYGGAIGVGVGLAVDTVGHMATFGGG
jgi:hypothetical protein